MWRSSVVSSKVLLHPHTSLCLCSSDQSRTQPSLCCPVLPLVGSALCRYQAQRAASPYSWPSSLKSKAKPDGHSAVSTKKQCLSSQAVHVLVQVAVSILKRPDWARTAVGAALSVLSDPEVRVRIAAGECLGEAAAILGSEAWTSCRIDVLDSIDRCWVSLPSSSNVCWERRRFLFRPRHSQSSLRQ